MNIVQMNVTLLDSMGSDLSVVNAARVSFNKESDWEEDGPYWNHTKKLKDSDAKLINYLAKHSHWTPFAHAFLSFRIKAPIFVARQLVKHQVGLAWNEVSRRYVSDEPEFWMPANNQWRLKPEGNIKQGSSDKTISVDHVGPYPQITQHCLDAYNQILSLGVAPELARMVLPQNTMTEWIWSGSLAAFARVVKLRTDPHAQAETSEIATAIDVVVRLKGDFKHSWDALLGTA